MHKKLVRASVVLVAIGVGMSLFIVPATHAIVASSYQVVSARPAGSLYYGIARPSGVHAVSGDGRYVVFGGDNNLTDIVPGDTNASDDVFVRDTTNNTTQRVSSAADGTIANGYSEYGSISYDGRYVAFVSNATNLVSGVVQYAGMNHVYLKDLKTGAVSLIDQTASGTIGNKGVGSASVSADGRYVVFPSTSTNLVSTGNFYVSQVYVKDTHTGALAAVSITPSGVLGNDSSGAPDISCDGGTIVFASTAPNLGVPTGVSGRSDLIVAHMSWNGPTEMEDVTSYTTYGIHASDFGVPQVSCDGNNVLFVSSSVNVVSPATPSGMENTYEYNRLTGVVTQASLGSSGAQVTGQGGYSQNAAMSADGRYVAFTSHGTMTDLDPDHPRGSDTGSGFDVYIRDIKKGTTELATIAPSGQRASWGAAAPIVGLNADGSSLVFNYITPSNGTGQPVKSLISGYNTGQTYSSEDVYKVDTGY